METSVYSVMSTSKRKANSFRVKDSTHDNDHTAVIFSPIGDSFIKQRRSRNFVWVTGRFREETLFFAEREDKRDDISEQYVRLTHRARLNLRVSVGDFVSLTSSNDMDNHNWEAEEVTLNPLIDKGLRIPAASDLARNIRMEIYWIAKQGDYVSADYGPTHHIEFVVQAVGSYRFGVVTPATDITFGEGISRAEADALKLAGFDDIGGYQKQMSQIREMVELPIRCPQLFMSIGVRAPRSILLHGPPGSGKSLIARAIANETGSSLFLVDGLETVAQSDPRTSLQNVFDNAEGGSPSIIVIDNIDFIAPNRDKTNLRHEQEAHAAILHCINGLRYRSNVVVIAITNNLENVDPTLRRFGRLGYEVYVGAPDLNDRLSILRIHCKNLKLAKNVDLETIAAQTVGYVGSDLAALCFIASMRCIRNTFTGTDVDHHVIGYEMLNALQVGMQDFESALSFIVDRSI